MFLCDGRLVLLEHPHVAVVATARARFLCLPSDGHYWLIDVDGWDGTLADRTDTDSVSITVGSEANGGHFGFDPLALRCSTGTTVSFEWTGEGGAHNVAFEDGPEKSDIYAEAGTNFEVTLDEPGVYRYACAPHQSIGQRGGIVVEE